MGDLSQLASAGRNSYQEQQYQQLLKQNNIPFTIQNGVANVAGFGTGGNGMGDQARSFFTPANIQSNQAATTAQANYQAGIGSAVSTLQGAGTSLDQQYKTLLNNVLGQGTVAMNTVTTGENNLLGQRGITNNSPLYSQQMGSAQLPVQVANQTAVGNLGFTEAQLQNTLASQIAGIQQGGAQFSAGLPLAYGSLALAQAANIANIGLAGSQAQQAGVGARYIPIPGVGLWDIQANRFVGGVTNNNLTSGGYQILNVP